MSPLHEQRYDVIIAGGGMVGSALACLLSGHGLEVAVIDRDGAPLEPFPATYATRTSAITEATRRLFVAIGAWRGMQARRVFPYRTMEVRDAGSGARLHFDSADAGTPDLGHIVENRVILAALRERLAEHRNIHLIAPAEPAALHLDSDAARLRLDDGRHLAAPLLVAADGGRSRIRELAGLTTWGWHGDHHAVVTWVRCAESHQNSCYQRFLPDGPVGFLGFDPHHASIVWSTTPERAEALAAMDEAVFCAELGAALEHRFGAVEACGERAVWPLVPHHAHHYTRPRLALVGDAAHRIHPLAGQGVNIGLLDAAALAEVVGEAHRSGREIGDHAVLRRYERWRKGDNLTVQLAMEAIKRLFAVDATPFTALRGTGLRLLDRAEPIKKPMIRRAMGLSGDLPRVVKSSGG